ncbi:Sulfite exporter TauE/SafE [Seminavis robusta]|uniref:Sulfite exporter TauE/SafE n=1 Tax=Seminavis robusta TaxID=568900 RepID=A0A9N8DU45_9STRA|nr:Sulfite exporter TauE/SafE [Seminavis robusta]|eukprot:Sro250_g099060.1 Sulfite exporter TauE/SafE (2302) ;mRNA; f:60448-67574
MMKRSRQPEEDELGATEFAAALNGDDPHRILDCLKRFSRIVRHQRRQALFPHTTPEDNDDSEEDDTLEDDYLSNNANTKNKKFKASEAWKEDTRSYQVPFVGTSVAKGDGGTVVVGQWPTGLLKAYLDRSPVATELTSDDLIPPTGHVHKTLLRRQQGKLSHAIFQAYLKALAELTTAAIPRETLQQQQQQSRKQRAAEDTAPRFLETLLSDRVPGLIALLQSNTKRGKTVAGPLIPLVLQILTRIIQTRVQSARNLARLLEQSPPEAVWRSIIRLAPPPRQQHNNNSNQPIEEQDNDRNNNHPPRKDPSKRNECRTAFLHMVRAFLETRDTTVLHYISATGSKDRKLISGVLVLALREGLRDTFHPTNNGNNNNAYYQEMALFLETVRRIICHSASLVSLRGWIELLPYDVLHNLCELSIHAPRLGNNKPDNQFQLVLAIGNDGNDESGTTVSLLQQAGREARRVLWILLVDNQRSPLLKGMRNNNNNHNNNNKNREQAVVIRAMCRLLETHPLSGKMGLHRCILHGIQQSPSLLPALFLKLNLPDSSNHPFAFCARLRFVCQLLREGPVPLGDDDDNNNQERTQQEMLRLILPMGMTRQVFTRAIQGKNDLCVAETIKCLLCILERLQVVQVALSAKAIDSSELTKQVIAQLPDVKAILPSISRYDLDGGFARAAPIIRGHLCQLLLSVATIHPGFLSEVKFDWMKMLPSNASNFRRLPLVLQAQLLRTLEKLLNCSTNPHISPAACALLLEILTTCRTSQVYTIARRICVFLLSRVAPAPFLNEESQQNIRYEISCWIDCMAPRATTDFRHVLESASKTFLNTEVSLFRAWKDAGLSTSMPKESPSAILVTAIVDLSNGSWSTEMEELVLRVTAKCLLFNHNPMPIATLITYFLGKKRQSGASSDGVKAMRNQLLKYAKTLVDFDDSSNETKRNSRLHKLLGACFSETSFHRKVFDWWRTGDSAILSHFDHLSREDAIAAIRQLSHIIACNSHDSSEIVHYVLRRRNIVLLRRIIGSALLDLDDESDLVVQNTAARLTDCDLARFQFFLIVHGSRQSASDLLSHLKSIELRTSSDPFGGHLLFSVSGEARERFLMLTLIGPFLSPEDLNEAFGTLLRLWSNEKTKSDRRVLLPALKSCTQEVLARPMLEGLDSAGGALKAWLSVSDCLRNGERGEALELLCGDLEALLCRSLDLGTESAKLYLATVEVETKELVWSTTRLRSELDSSTGCLLTQLFDCDPYRFASYITRLLVLNDQAPRRLWLSSTFERCLQGVLERKDIMKTELLVSDAKELGDAVLQRATVCLEQIMTNREPYAELQVFRLVGSLDSSFDVDSNVKVALCRKTTSFLMSSAFNKGAEAGILTTSALLAFLEGCVQLISFLDEDVEVEATVKRDLCPAFFARLCKLLPRSLRNHFKGNGEKLPSDPGVAPSLLIRWMCQLAKQLASFDMDSGILEKSVGSTLRSCLKYGMAEADDTARTKTATICLQLAIELVPAIHAAEIAGKSDNLPTAEEIYSMVVSHSRFQATLFESSDGGQNDARKLELVRLLLSCVSLSTTTITFSSSVWDALFSAYNASVGVIDATLRRLLYVASTKQGESESLPFLDQYRWKDTQGHPDAKAKYSWDWLVNGLQLGRVRETLRCFPLDDAVEPRPMLVHIENRNRTDVVADGDDNFDIPKTTKSAGDSCYSPGYILPLVFSALEACLEGTASTLPGVEEGKTLRGEGTENLPGSVVTSELLAKTAQRLCEKGALSLTLASLCSRCARLRQIAVAVLGLFVQALNTDEAVQIKSWRERPQLAMLLHSVQRALAVRRSVILAEAKGNQEEESPAWLIVPKLPGFSAIFLAQAALILARPGDAMYTPINKYFLGKENDHGAFRDLNRLPAFVMFFCSSAHEPAGQARMERLFALRLFRDGFLDDYCFKSASSCHAPALLMSSLTNFRSRSSLGSPMDVEEECLLLLEAIERMFVSGGHHGSHLLIDRMGSLSWLRAVLELRDLKHVLPTRSCRFAFLKLLKSAVDQAVGDFQRHGDGRDGASLTFEVTSLAQPTLNLGVMALEEVESSRDGARTGEVPTEGATSCIETFHSLQRALRISAKGETLENDCFRDDGVLIQTVLAFFSKATTLSTTEKDGLLGTLISFPLSSRAPAFEAIDFCGMLLDALSCSANPSRSIVNKATVVGLIHKVLLTMNRLAQTRDGNTDKAEPMQEDDSGSDANSTPQDDAPDDTESNLGSQLIPKLLMSQKVCFRWPESQSIWFECLRTALRDSSGAPSTDEPPEQERMKQTINLLLKYRVDEP